jgi:hypothetical protein
MTREVACRSCAQAGELKVRASARDAGVKLRKKFGAARFNMHCDYCDSEIVKGDKIICATFYITEDMPGWESEYVVVG